MTASPALHVETPEQLIGNARALGPKLAAAADEIDEARQLPIHVVDAIRESGAFRMSMPRAWGGCQADPLTQNRVIEEISAASGSAGWCVMIASANAYFNTFLDQGAAREMYPDPNIVTAAAFAPPGRATKAPGGYRVSGRWPFGSGITHSKWVVGATILMEGDEPVLGDSGVPLQLHAIAPIEEVEVLDTWRTGGLRGSGSNDFAFNDLFIPAEHTFDIFRGKSQRPGPLWALNSLFLANHPGVPLGIGRGALEEFARIIKPKTNKFGGAPPREQPTIQISYANATALVESSRGFVYAALGSLWDTLVAGEKPTIEQRAKLRLSITYAHDACARAVDELYHAAGSATVYTPNTLDRYFRDIHTACQHVVAASNIYAAAGKALLTDVLPPLW